MIAAVDPTFRLFPQQASTLATDVDHLFYYLMAVTVFFTALIFLLVGTFAVRYRRRASDEFPRVNVQNMKLEITWCIVPFLFMLVMFFWGAEVYAKFKRPPEHAMTIDVIGKQWMWKVQHPDGVREINEMHIPVGVPIRLMMGSQDVIHSFFIPAFRVKQDVVPGSFSTEWFTATKPGVYHLFCAQYCGEEHSKMVGEIIALEPGEYQHWLAQTAPQETPAAAGARLFVTWGCNACHGTRAPTLAGLYMNKVPLDNGSSVIADENYLRESIIEPSAKIVAGFPPIMPSYRGQLSEEALMQLVAYIKSLGSAAAVDGSRTVPATLPVNGQGPDALPDYPPARQPPAIRPGEVERGMLTPGKGQ